VREIQDLLICNNNWTPYFKGQTALTGLITLIKHLIDHQTQLLITIHNRTPFKIIFLIKIPQEELNLNVQFKKM
jgi:hypothetical protein